MKVLVIGDCHAPAMHPRYISFLKGVHKKHKCTKVVHIGDLVDRAAISFHEKDPDGPSAKEEKKKAMGQVKKMYEAFPEVEMLTGNHDSLPFRKARTVGIPEDELNTFQESWGLYGWTVHDRYDDIKIDGVIYRHGDKCKGGSRIAAMANAKDEHCSLVQGHLHAQFGIEFAANQDRVIWGMQVGCGVQPNHPSMKYSRVYSARPILGCGVVIDGEPILERMKLS